MSTAKLIIADSERNADLYYATRFLAPDSFIFIQRNGHKTLLMSDLEVDRARSQSTVTDVISYSKVAAEAKKRLGKDVTMMEVVDELLRRDGIKELEVPFEFGVAYADRLRKLGYEIKPVADPFYPERVIKTEEEIQFLIQSLRATEKALAEAIELIRRSEVRASDQTLWVGKEQLTAESVRRFLHLRMMELDCVGQHTIIACGTQAVDPHNIGSGPLYANQTIVMDVFPQHAITRYYADITRTVVKGKASEKVRRMHDAVLEGQNIAYRMIKEGADGGAIHNAIQAYFDSLGFKTGEQDGRMQGFFHGTGHGVGIEIHEAPRISPRGDILKAGMVVTVEPGLYYMDAGGIRIEDMVVVTKDGCRLLNEAPKQLEI